MIKEGKEGKRKYWGKYVVKKVIKLIAPIICQSDEVGEVEFNPTIVQIEWDKYPSEDKHDLWFPYWIKIHGKEHFGQYAPMIGQKALLQLLSKAIDNDLFTKKFLTCLKNKITDKLNKEMELTTGHNSG